MTNPSDFHDLLIPLPLRWDGQMRNARIVLPKNLSEADWAYLANLAEVAKPGLVAPPVSLVKKLRRVS